MTSSAIHSPRRRGRSTRRNLALAAIVAGTLSTGWTPGASAAPRHGDRIELRRDADAITALGVTGVQARLVTPDGRNVTATSGVADLTTRRPVSPDGYLRIASVTKTFVATVILQLAGDGRLSLDDTVERWLPGVVSGNGNDGRAITIRNLLQHTSGIHDDYPDYTSAEDFYQHRYDTYTAEQIVARAMRHRPDFQPGTDWSYSNTGYVLLGMVIQRVTGHPWHEEVRDRIVRPLGLRHTFWPGTSPTLPRPHAETYQRFESGGPLVDVTEQVGLVGNGEAGLVSTTADLDRFFRVLLGGRLLPPAQLAQMKQAVPVGEKFEPLMPGARDGLGIFSRPLSCGGTYWGHEGGDSGWITATGVTADGRHGVTVSLSGANAESADHVLRIEAAESTLVDDALCATSNDGRTSRRM
ncbi:serine hydrolase domain-containing protein [Actinoallomurus rhizosphaericola]|uniref:serine hydrolase domain-containing protein n=1 Tax=Actinoallomurus rhizosphaericola TaxID=2952536 RepID=UPI00209278F6|nr:serine hydrolase domain-containing protein [Actinoallomurus rhizosphaericola]MCO5999029.1 beta-lactamase family protein [Actinoallomurus rhizosphaericola]